MAILIVDEPAGRRPLREFLLGLELGRVFEARSGEDALRILAKERSRIDLIISALDLPHMGGQELLRALRGPTALPGADLTAFLLLTSDLGSRQLHDLRHSSPRFDAHLAKPFRRSELKRAIRRATRVRNASRDALLYIGNISDELLNIRSAMRLRQNHWSQLFHGATPAELDEALHAGGRALGGVLVDPDVYAGLGQDWLSRFRQTRLGARAPVLCLGRDPERIGRLRSHCDFFIEPSGDWVRVLNLLSLRVTRADELAARSIRLKRLRHEGRKWRAIAAAYRLASRDPGSSAAHAQLGEILHSYRLSRAATKYARSAVELNPCSPRARLLELALATSTHAREAAQAAALAFCPRHPEVLAAVTGRRLSP